MIQACGYHSATQHLSGLHELSNLLLSPDLFDSFIPLNLLEHILHADIPHCPSILALVFIP
jgi:hypothetical protein